MMTIKFSRTAYPYKQSDLQKKQWAQFAAIGYSIGIRGYLLCWQELLKRAEVDRMFVDKIGEMIEWSVIIEKRARWNIKHLRSLK